MPARLELLMLFQVIGATLVGVSGIPFPERICRHE